PEVRSALVFLGLVLLLITSILNISGRLLIRRLGTTGKKSRPAPVPPPAPETNGEALPNTPVLAAVEREPVQPLPSPRLNQFTNRIMTVVLAGCLVLTLGPLFLILGYIAYRGGASLNWALFTELPKRLNGEPAGGLAHAMVGSAMLVSIATVMAVPIGILAAIFLAETRNYRLAAIIRFVPEILGGVPSIVIGIFAYAVLVLPKYGGVKPLGFSAWAGSFALGVMMLPVVVRAAEEALRLVPQTLRHASYALGANYWQTVMRVTLPAALPAGVTGIILAAARISGETAPLLLAAHG